MALRVMGIVGGGLLLLVGLFPLIWVAAQGEDVIVAGALIYLAIALTGLALVIVSLRAGGRPCPQCGKNVKRGLVVCPTCSFDFTLPRAS